MKYLIYKISCNLGNYIGSTKTTLKKRISAHKCSRASTCKDFFDHEYEVSIVEEIETDDKIYVLKREQYWIDNTDNTVNKYPTHYEGKQYRLKKAFIYKISGKQGNYIGSTRRDIDKRIIQHKSSKKCGCRELFNDDYEVIKIEHNTKKIMIKKDMKEQKIIYQNEINIVEVGGGTCVFIIIYYRLI